MNEVILRCRCGAALVTDEGASIRVNMSQWRIFKDTGKVTATCRRCPREIVLDEGLLPLPFVSFGVKSEMALSGN